MREDYEPLSLKGGWYDFYFDDNCDPDGFMHRPPYEHNKINSLLFHNISPHELKGPCASPDYFEDVLKMIRIGEKITIRAEDVVRYRSLKNIPRDNFVLLTFDDGDSGVYDYAFPLLKKYKMNAVFFVATFAPNAGRPKFCGWSDLERMEESGVFEIHSHSQNHPNLTEISKDELNNELINSMRAIQSNLNNKILYIAYPFGFNNERERTAAKKMGYAAGFKAGPDPFITIHSDLYALPRTTIVQLYTQELVCRKLGLDLSEIRKGISVFG